jgi:hypothetical protein
MKNKFSSDESENLFRLLKTRFEKNMNRHKNIEWLYILAKLDTNSQIRWSINEMEKSGGEPDVVIIEDNCCFVDCSAETPMGRRSICYDRSGLESRKEHKPANNALDMAETMGIEILNEEQYRELQQYGKFDSKTSSWIKTPDNIRKLGGALFCDYRYGQVFVYHNGAQSYYSARGFRGLIKI